MIKFWKYFQSDYWLLKRYRVKQEKITEIWNTKYGKLSDKALQQAAIDLKTQYQKNNDLEKLLIPAYAVACEAILRLKKIRLHPVQIIAGIVLHYGNVAELKTGEGKTLASVLPAFLNSFLDKPIFIVTVNEYLVNRDFEDNGEIFKFLNLTVGKTLSTMNYAEKQKNYRCNIVYGVNSEFGFDYLRDNMLPIFQRKIQLSHSFVIIDEVDSALIDEGRTPLIISGKPKDRSEWYHRVDKFVKTLNPSDYKIDPESRRCFLQPSGVMKVNRHFNIENLFNLNHSLLFHGIINALQANFILKNNVDYLVKDKKIMLIDQFTGRIMADRMLSEGLHQAVQAKENCEIQNETNILATITYQNYFRIFDKISGMTGTGKTEEEEFINIFNMRVLQIPTHRPVIRHDDNDYFFYDQQSKYSALINHVQKLHEKGQPILIGTCSVQVSENIGKILKRMGFNFHILNAKRYETEAKIIAKAGIHRTITIATNMAGRGTDIKLDDQAKAAGGLAILGVERNESRRIDLQLQGRSGRQGDPGYAAFYISLDDQLFRRFDSRSLKKRFAGLKNRSLNSRLLNNFIKKAQTKLRNSSYEQRKTMLEYDNVISQQRQIVYSQRTFIIESSKLSFQKYLVQMIHQFLNFQWKRYFGSDVWEISDVQLLKFFEMLQINYEFPLDNIRLFQTHYAKPEALLALEGNFGFFYSQLMLKFNHWVLHYSREPIVNNLDDVWTTHLDELFRLKSSSFLHSYAQKKPLQIFITEADNLFQIARDKIIFEATRALFLNWKRLQKQLQEMLTRANQIAADNKTNKSQANNQSSPKTSPKIKSDPKAIQKVPKIPVTSIKKGTTRTG